MSTEHSGDGSVVSDRLNTERTVPTVFCVSGAKKLEAVVYELVHVVAEAVEAEDEDD